MATYTTNYNLKKPADSDFVNIADLNGNADIIDIELGKKAPAPIIGTAPPTTSTVGVVGQEYIDKTNKRVWYCTAAEARPPLSP